MVDRLHLFSQDAIIRPSQRAGKNGADAAGLGVWRCLDHPLHSHGAGAGNRAACTRGLRAEHRHRPVRRAVRPQPRLVTDIFPRTSGRQRAGADPCPDCAGRHHNLAVQPHPSRRGLAAAALSGLAGLCVFPQF